jgi:hypothetical protein
MDDKKTTALSWYLKYTEGMNREGYTELESELLYQLENNKDFPVELARQLAIDYIHNSALIRRELYKLFQNFGNNKRT